MRPYDQHDEARWVPEPPGNPERSPFERDRARVLHSDALRRLASKTQVVAPVDQMMHSPRTRLTHSLECAQIGREMGKALNRDPDLVETACLAHDLGHPPFGHNGEFALNQIAERAGGFEGNAQSLRLLSRLEAKVITEDGINAGLNLTRATLDAAIKYPWDRSCGDKFCVYPDDMAVFEWVRQGAPPGSVSFEAQIMDWADDVAYAIHDLEDALHSGYVTPSMLRDPAERLEVCKLTQEWYLPDADLGELEETFTRLIGEPLWPGRFDGGFPDLAALKQLTSTLIGRFCRRAQDATREAYVLDEAGRHDADLVVPHVTRLECALLKGVTVRFVIGEADNQTVRARQRELLAELTSLTMLGAPHTLQPALRPAFENARDDAGRLRAVIDQIASLTDASATAMHRMLSARSA
ncbi:deoxyguanosinetriphosphate triphosphohydrolase [Herbidospora sp. NBRC 101105]|uniref:deoxyguanosinetriphosphate triphosphohydrolase n=1 Tax=Herbidospora sp. NBRC 101105 TaxID=3032195 RepID=UPI0024A394A3|nr:deoxyguanosinetriphosphate triphosphohydrolase [Herbidospora sp. NBRC 101105]GLX92363.1 deoxyguanosinetriphosphate triphosphohydrolase-like protein [Herbidospora sp. NBRC 101105]